MNLSNKCPSLWGNIWKLDKPQIRAFHMSWFAFFLCFFAWFGVAPLMSVIRDEMSLTKDQIGWCIIGSVAATAFARLLVGQLCDRIGPRLAYTWLLLFASIPVMAIGFATDYSSFLFFRIAIGAIGGSFVITQYHTSIMFDPKCVGAANATSAGWGNLGGGATQLVMPIVFGLFVTTIGLSTAQSWRACMFGAGVLCAITGVAYYFLTQDTPDGNFKDLRASGAMPSKKGGGVAFLSICQDRRVWALFLIYGACFGVELTINNMAALYFLDYFQAFKSMERVQAISYAGMIAGLFGFMNLFSRTMGGIASDRFAARWGLSARVKWLFVVVLCEGMTLMLFSQISILGLAIPVLLAFSLFVQMSSGATFAIVPFINKKALGSVAGIVGAGGNAGAVLAGFLLKMDTISWPNAFFIVGALVTCSSFVALSIKFSVISEVFVPPTYESSFASEMHPEVSTTMAMGVSI